MNVARPYAGIATSVDGDVLVALTGTTSPRTGRQVARLVRQGSQSAVNAALERLVRQGLVHRESTPSALFYTLNREHVGYPAVAALAEMRAELVKRLRELVAAWGVPSVHVSMFGSAARGDGDAASDVDLVVIRSHDVDEEDVRWLEQLSGLSRAVSVWSGNAASIVELGETALRDTIAADPPVVAAWRRDAVLLAGRSLEDLIGGSA